MLAPAFLSALTLFLLENVQATSPSQFYWIDVTPTEDLDWHPCYQPLRRECARLLVPLNHLNQSDESSGNASIALIRIPSPFANSTFNTTHVPDPRYRGPILFNPGGPGGSGIDFLNLAGDMLAQVLGDEFDLVSFDPRGVARSTPKILFLDSPGRGEREVWDSDPLGVIRDGAGDPFRNVTGEKGNTLEWLWARAVTTNKQAEARNGEWLGYVNTEQTAHDMLSIVNASGRDKLAYWGFSYGSLLGMTFASLFPDKIERVVVDGVVDGDNYYATLWSDNLLDTPKTMNLFFETCHAAGSSLCPLWAPSPALIAANLTRIYQDIITNPIPYSNGTAAYGVLDFSHVRGAVFTSLYSPYASWPKLARALSELGSPERNPTAMWELIGPPIFRCSCSGTCNDKDTREQDFEAAVVDSRSAIACSDGADFPSDVVHAREFFDDLSEKSEWADVWSQIHLYCSGWPKVKKGYQGPVGAATSSPLLFVSNTADPVTPHAGAEKMSARFPGSRLLTQDAPGHTSVNSPSNCTLSYIREYFLSGKLPPEGTVCPVDRSPFSNVTYPLLGLGGLSARGDIYVNETAGSFILEDNVQSGDEAQLDMDDVVSPTIILKLLIIRPENMHFVQPGRQAKSLLAAASFLLLTKSTAAAGPGFSSLEARASNSSSQEFYGIDVEPTENLVWYPCYQPLRRECARLLVPLDHLDKSNNSSKTAAIALIRVPSPYADSSLNPTNGTDPRYRGPVLFNPGGPGGGGVDFINGLGDSFTTILGPEFDIVGFDPRGVQRSTPKIQFWDAPGHGEREVWNSDSSLGFVRGGPGDPFRHITGETGNSLEWSWAYARTSNLQAKARGGDWLGYTTTEQTVHDMLSILDAYGQKKLMYWGVSYGTVIGATFATLFPDRVERILMDGVVDSDNYYATLWNNNLIDTSKTVDVFFKTCYAAGKSGCPLWAPSPSLIEANLNRIYKELIVNPIPYSNGTFYGFVDYPKVRGQFFSSLVSPFTSWFALAQALSDLGSPQRDPTKMWELSAAPAFHCSCSGSTCDDKETRERDLVAAFSEARTGIACSDGADLPDDIASLRSWYEDFSKTSEWANAWAQVHIACVGFPKVKKGFQGPVGAKNTSSPMLFVTNTADPLTPSVNARKMAARFPGSGLLTLDAPGHSSVFVPSNCTWTHAREYFVSGTLPAKGTVCPADISPFPGLLGASDADSSTGGASVVRRDAVHTLGKVWQGFATSLLRRT
ncbi:hypothetical protein NP233_g9157 [Leucocoprinus birnbaumii]|uniref:Peptidase S33 tripeptidyl aminopeptidase-like C-terminal domain-containing protein n=1 Tax=Leucocoprinus birnbaumii TaxID=56174 RepID=A0AAD5VL88_9AGAR|nr:hypothetical protein NP233_g9157 [Leucocoprinus birnbaumii]